MAYRGQCHGKQTKESKITRRHLLFIATSMILSIVI